MATTARTAGLNDDLRSAIVSRIREDEIVAMCCEVIDIPSPTGGELEMARYMRAAMERLGIVAAKPNHTAGILAAIIDELEEEL